MTIRTYISNLETLPVYNQRLERISHEYFGRDAQMEAILKLGVETFGLSMGVVSQINGRDYTIQGFYPPESTLYRGQVFDAYRTYCDITYRLRHTTAIPHMKLSPYSMHFSYPEFSSEAYFGTPLFARGELYGTLCFLGQAPRTQGFFDAEKAFLDDLASAVSRLLK